MALSALGAAGVLAAVAACDRELPTAPRSTNEPATSGPQFDGDPAPPLRAPQGSEVPHGITATIGIPNPVNGSVSKTQIGVLPRKMWARMTISQRVTQTGGGRGTIVAGPQGRYVAGFYDNTCVLQAVLAYDYTWGSGNAFRPGQYGCPSDDSGEPSTVHSGLYHIRYDSALISASRTSGSYPLCETKPNCYAYSGSTTYILTPSTDGTLRLAASPGHVAWGTPVTFTATRQDGRALSGVERWIWKPSNSLRTPRTVACAGTSVTCTVPVYEDGWMFVHAAIGGPLHTAYAGVTVAPPKVVLTASATTPKEGDVVTYTASPDPASVTPFAVTRWRFVPDDTSLAATTPCGSDNPCADAAVAAGTMWVHATLDGRSDSAKVRVTPYRHFTLNADRSTVLSGEEVTFTPYMDGQPVAAGRWRWAPSVEDASDVAPCADGTQECRKTMVASGTMWAYVGPSAGRPDSAKAFVRVGTICTSANSGSEPCSLATAGGGSGRYRSLRVKTHGGVAGWPMPADSVIVIAFDTAARVHYTYSAASGYTGTVAFVDSILRSRDSTLAMDRSHTIEVGANPDYASRPHMASLRSRLRAVVNAASPQAHAAHLKWYYDSTASIFADPDSLDAALRLAEYLELHPLRDSAALLAFDAALANHEFEIDLSGPETVILVLAPTQPPPPIVASREPQAPALSRSTSASTSVGIRKDVRFVYINGIRTTPGGVIGDRADLARLLRAAGFSLTSVRATHYWNSNFRGRLLALTDRHLGCAGMSRHDGSHKIPITLLEHYALCKGISVVSTVLIDDLIESATQFDRFMDEKSKESIARDALYLAGALRRHHEALRHAIGVTHSQGNMMIAQAVDTLKARGMPPQRDGVCIGEVSLAAPIYSWQFGLDAPYLRGMTIAGDILLLIGLPNNFEPYLVSTMAESAQREIAAAGPAERRWLEPWWGYRIHDVRANYFRDANVGPTLRSYMWQVHDQCQTL